MDIDSKFAVYKNLLLKWQKSVNLISPSTTDHIDKRHFVDSKQLFDFIKNKNLKIADLGSGAGFPGMILAIMGCSNVTLIESDKKKAIFLQNVSRETKTPVKTINKRIENVSRETFDVITARALATTSQILIWSDNLRHNQTEYLLLKSGKAEQELTEARQLYYFEDQLIQSQTDPNSYIVRLSHIQRLKNEQ